MHFSGPHSTNTLGQTLVRHPACGAFLFPLFGSPLKIPSDSLFEPAVIDERCGLDKATSVGPRARCSYPIVSHTVDKQRHKCHLQHTEIDVVILTARKPA